MTATSSAPSVLRPGCRLVAADGRTLPLRGVALSVEAGGGLAAVRVVQTFRNPFDCPLAVTYQLPLPADGVVVGFSFTLDGQRVVGQVQRRADARAAFEAAVVEGRTAALLEQDRSSLFTQELGNLPPGSEVEISVEVEQPLAWRTDSWSWRFPTVVAPRYLDTKTPDADRISVDVADTDPQVPCRVQIHLSDVRSGPVHSPSHELTEGAEGIELRGTLDRDLVLRWPVAASQPGVQLEASRPAASDEAFGLLTLVPPTPDTALQPVTRDLILLLDTSGSMGGAPLAQLKALSRALVEGLRPGDHLEMIEFSRRPNRWRSGSTVIDASARAEALAWLDGLVASGGTRMHDGIYEALRTLHAEALRQVVLVTDGLIGFEHEIVSRILHDLPTGCRVHTVGIGSAPNRSLTGPAARAGSGHEVIVGVGEPVEPLAERLLSHTLEPLVVDVQLEGDALVAQAPAMVPDLLRGAPARISLQLAPQGGTLTVSGRTRTGRWSEVVEVPPATAGTGRRVVATRFARERVEDLEMQLAAGLPRQPREEEIEALGLAHQIATRLTSWVAATAHATVDPEDPTRRIRQPQALPHGMSAEGVGLRPVAPPPPGPRSSGARAPARAIARDVKRKVRSRARGERQAGNAGPKPGRMSSLFSRLRPGAPSAPEEIAVAPTGSSSVPADSEPPVLERAPAPEPGPRDVPGAPVPVAQRPPAPPAPLRLRGRVRSNQDGFLVVEVTVDQVLRWSAVGTWVVHTADGRRIEVSAVSGTTRPGTLQPGQTARIRLPWSGDAPRSLALAHLVVTLA